MIVYPRSTGSGIKACLWVETVCRLAGISDIGVKVGCRIDVESAPGAWSGIKSWLSEKTACRMADVSDMGFKVSGPVYIVPVVNAKGPASRQLKACLWVGAVCRLAGSHRRQGGLPCCCL